MDRITRETRSWNMSRVGSKNTTPELLVRSFLHNRGYRFRLHVKQLPGTPDVVLPKYSAAIFIHGCFWHGHSDCKGGGIPKTRPLFWQDKILKNVTRDRKALSKLDSQGWRIAVVWECALKNKNTISHTSTNLDEWIRSGLNYLELHGKAQKLEVRS